jgi:hypothetical protein
MAARSTGSGHNGVQRFLADLRMSIERRSFADRRAANRAVPLDRRDGGDRRQRVDRRQQLSEYSDEQAAEIREMILDPTAHVSCPACGEHLMLGPPTRQDEHTVRRVHCTHCRRSVAIRTPPS